MAGDQTVGDLYKVKAIQEADLDAAVDAFMADPTTNRFAIGRGYTVDPHAAVAASPFASATMVRADAREYGTRAFVRMAILLSKPVRGGA